MAWYRILIGLIFAGLPVLSVAVIINGAESRREYLLLAVVMMGYISAAVYWLMMGVL